MKPTRLYVKEHSVTGLRYFGKTSQQDIEKYKGSGVYWKNHIKKHGISHVRNIWVSDWFTCKEDLVEFSLAFSELFDIVNSNEWANLMEENGLSGALVGDDNVAKNPEVRKKISEALMGHPGVKNKGSTGFPAHNKNKQVWNNGIVQQYSDMCPGKDWIYGELPSTKLKKSLAPRTKGYLHHNHGRVKSVNEIEKTREKNRKQYIVTFPDGSSKIICGLIDFCREYDLDTAGAQRVLNGTQKLYKQYKFERVADVS